MRQYSTSEITGYRETSYLWTSQHVSSENTNQYNLSHFQKLSVKGRSPSTTARTNGFNIRCFKDTPSFTI